MSLERNRLEAKYKNAMIESLSHELKTPLNSIIGNTYIMLDLAPETM